jgi:hypothetical protein
MRVSWQHHRIVFKLDGSPSAIAWLHKNIASMQRLFLDISVELPDVLLQGLIDVGR